MGDFSKKLLGIFLGISLSLGVGVNLGGSRSEVTGVRATSQTLTISTSDFTTTSYAANTGGTKTIAGIDYQWASQNVMQSSSNMQWKKKDGVIFNKTALGSGITSIALTFTSGSFTYAVATTSTGLDNATYSSLSSGTSVSISGSNPYFKIKVGSSATGKSTKLVVTFDVSVSTSPLSNISLSEYETNYYVGDKFSFDGTCTATFEDGSSRLVTPTSISEPDMTTAGDKTIIVSYTDPNDSTNTKTAEYTINVTQWPYEGRGTSTDPFTVSDAYSIANELDTDANNGKVVYVKGVVSSTVSVSSSKGTFDITDGTKTLKAYSISGVSSDPSNAKYVGQDYRVVVGGALINYNGTLEVGYVSSALPSSLYSSKAPATLTLNVPETLDFNDDGTFTATTDGTNPTITWSSSNDDICYVDTNGDYLAGSETGKVTIKASLTYDDCILPVEASKEIEIVDPNVHTVTITGDSKVKVGKTIQLTAECSKGDEITWTSSSDDNATVSSTGLVTGIAEGTTTITATCANGDKDTKVITIEPKDILFKKATSNDDLVFGKEVVIASSDGKYVMGEQNTNNRTALTSSFDGEYIIKESTTAVFTLLPAKDNGFAFYDKTNDAMLASNSSSSNNLKTDGDYGDENAYATVTISTDSASITFQGSNTRNQLKKNSSSMLFSCYGSGQNDIAIYVAADGDPESIGDTWAKQFNATANCDPTGSRTLSSDTWTSLTEEFKAQSIPEKMAASYLDVESSVATTDFVNAINNYEHCLTRYGYTGFINDRGLTTTNISNMIYRNNDANTAIMIVVLVSFVSVTAIGGYFFIKKRRYY